MSGSGMAQGPRDLEGPVLVAAFEGWNDAGDAATGAIDHLLDVWEATTVGDLDPEEYYDYQVNRPFVEIEGGGVRRLIWPSTRISVVRPPLAPRELVIVRGIEPNMRWRAFTAELIRWARELGAGTVITLGALMADTPHTRPVPISGTSGDEELRDRLGLEASRYEGPTGIVGVLQDSCSRAGIPAASLWAAVPHYVAQPPCPKATLALLHRLEDVLDVPIPLGDLTEEARAWQDGVDELAAEDDEVAAYVRQLEEQQDTADLPEASGEAIAREFERYLRRRPDGEG